MSSKSESDDDLAALVDAAIAGDRSAVNQLLATLEPNIIRYCRSRIGSTHGTFATADDVAQEVLIAVFQALDTYSDTGSRFLGFVFGIAKNKIADFYRKHTRDQNTLTEGPPELADPRAGPEVTALRTELGTKVAGLLNTLPSNQREIVFLRLGAGYSAEETAAAMCTTPGAIRVTQHRALNNLRKRIGDCNGQRNGYRNGKE